MKSKDIKYDAQLIVSNSETDADLLYSTRFFAPDPFIYFKIKNTSYLVLSDLEIDRAKETASVDKVLSSARIMKELKKNGTKKPGNVEIVHHIFSKYSISSILVPANFPIELADGLRKKGYKVHFKPDPFIDTRQFKSRQEIKHIIKSVRVAEKGMDAGINLIKKSIIGKDNFLYIDNKNLTSEIIRAEIDTTIMKSGYLPINTIVSSGNQCSKPHNNGSGPIKANKPIILDIFPRSQETGYFGDITRTVVKGQASVRLKKAYQTVLEGQRIAFEKIRDEIDGKDIHDEILKFFERRGFPTKKGKRGMEGFFHGTGHGVGLQVHEYPRISPVSFILKADHVVTVEPGLYYPGMGGVRIEDVILVTKTGIQNLTDYPKFLEIP